MPAPIRPQPVVVIRFSYPAEAGWQLARQGVAAARATLYDPARLARRFALFEALTLPSLVAQTDPDFTVAVLIGADFPAPWRARLADGLAPLRDARITALPPMNNYKATKQALTGCTRDDASHVISIRLDDDDAISRDCIAEHKRLAPLVLQMSGRNRPTVIGFNSGLFLELGAAGNALYGVTEKLPLGIGLGMVAPRTARPTIFSTDHRQLHTRWNCYTDGVTPHYIRTIHRDNDSGAVVYGKRVDHDAATLDTILGTRFAVTRDQLMALRP